MYFDSDIAAINSFIISFYNSFINKNFSSQKFLI